MTEASEEGPSDEQNIPVDGVDASDSAAAASGSSVSGPSAAAGGVARSGAPSDHPTVTPLQERLIKLSELTIELRDFSSLNTTAGKV